MALHDSGRPLEFSEDAHFWEEETEEERMLSEFIRRIDDEGLDSVYDDLKIFLEEQKENYEMKEDVGSIFEEIKTELFPPGSEAEKTYKLIKENYYNEGGRKNTR